MSRSALWRQEANVKERERKADETFQRVLEEGKLRSQKGLVRIINDTHFNLNPMLLQNISKSPYFQKCCNNLSDWSSLVDEIYYEVKSLEPWSNEATRTPSTAFCLLLRLFTMRCTTKEMEKMIEHNDSAYIRCIGFLYLRYICDPKELWDWFMPYLYDCEEVQVSEHNKKPGKRGQGNTVGDFVRSLLEDLEFHGTRLPRLPQGIEKEIKVKLVQEAQIESRAKSHENDQRRMDYFKKIGNKVIAMYGDDENEVTWYDAVIDRVLLKDDETGYQFSRPKFIVTFPEYGNTEKVSLGEVDMPGDIGGRRGDYDRSDNRDYRNSYGNRNYSHSNYSSSRGDKYAHRRERSRSRDRNDMREVANRRGRDEAFARGKSYSSRLADFSQNVSGDASGNGCYRSSNQDDFRHHKQANYNDDKKSQLRGGKEVISDSSVKQKSERELAAIKEKKRHLVAKYG